MDIHALRREVQALVQIAMLHTVAAAAVGHALGVGLAVIRDGLEAVGADLLGIVDLDLEAPVKRGAGDEGLDLEPVTAEAAQVVKAAITLSLEQPILEAAVVEPAV